MDTEFAEIDSGLEEWVAKLAIEDRGIWDSGRERNSDFSEAMRISLSGDRGTVVS